MSQSLRSANVVLGELPAFGGLLQPLQQTLALLLPGDVEKELEHDHSIAGEMALEFADILEAFLPDVLADQLGRDFLPLQQFGMHAHDQGLLVVRAVEDADPSSLRDADRRAPEKIVREILLARRLERVHVAALRVETRHDMLDHAILAGGIHPLQHDQQRPAAVGIEALLQLAEALEVVREHRLGVVLVVPAGVRGIERREAETVGIVNA